MSRKQELIQEYASLTQAQLHAIARAQGVTHPEDLTHEELFDLLIELELGYDEELTQVEEMILLDDKQLIIEQVYALARARGYYDKEAVQVARLAAYGTDKQKEAVLARFT